MTATETETMSRITTITVYGAWTLHDARQLALTAATNNDLVITNLRLHRDACEEAMTQPTQPAPSIEPTEPTIDGLTSDQLFELCEGTALIRIQADIRRSIGLPDIPPVFLPTVRVAVSAGILALWHELDARGLIVKRP